jgi:hypothetical protein
MYRELMKSNKLCTCNYFYVCVLNLSSDLLSIIWYVLSNPVTQGLNEKHNKNNTQLKRQFHKQNANRRKKRINDKHFTLLTDQTNGFRT